MGDALSLELIQRSCVDLERLPSSLSMEAEFRKQASQPLQWVDDIRESDDEILTSDTSGPGTPSIAHTRSPTPLVVAYCGTEPKKVAITSGVRAWTKHQAYGASDALIKYATASPLLPQQVAEMVSNLSVIARVSLKAAAFFIEVILEAVQDCTGTTLGITRRALISAVGSARAVHSLALGQAWDAKATGRSLQAASPSFLSILDKYTAVGIYLIHHTFTLTELFAMGTFQFFGSTLTAALAAADESVRTIDGLFGSNETSRALSSFITLVRAEVNEDPRFAKDGTVSILNKLTKAVTAFAVLQNSTYKRSAKSMKMRVIYDCTILGEVEAKSWRSLMVGSGNFVRSRPAALLVSAAEELETLSLRSPPCRNSSLLTPDYDMQPSASSIPSSRSRGFLGDGLCLTDISPATAHRTTGKSSWTPPISAESDIESDVPGDASLIADLNFLFATGDDENSLDSSLTDDQLPSHLRRRLQAYTDNQLRAGIVLRDESPETTPKQRFRRIKKTNRANGNRETIYEITTEIIETVETVTTVEEPRPSQMAVGRRNVPTISPLSARHGSAALPSSRPGVLRRDVTSSKSGTESRSIFEGGRETKLEEDEEWCEIRTTNSRPEDEQGTSDVLHSDDASDDSMDLDPPAGALCLPEAPNGHRLSGKSKGQGSSKMPVVLKTMTKKLIQKRKTIRRIEVEETHSDDFTAANTLGLNLASRGSNSPANYTNAAPVSPILSSINASVNSAGKEKHRNPSYPRHDASSVPLPSKGSDLGRGLNKVFRRARHPFKSDQQHMNDSEQSEFDLQQRPRPQPPTVAVDSPSQTAVRQTITSSAHTTPFTSPGKTKRTLESVPGSERKVSKRSGTSSGLGKTSPRAATKDLPPIPQRGASQHTLFSAGAARPPFAPSTPQGSLRENRLRNRAPSITSIRSFASRSHLSSFSSAPPNLDKSRHGFDPASFPQAHLVENLRRFMRYSSAAYGQNFMRILGIGSLDYFFPDTSKHHANVWAFAHHVGIPVDCILLNSFAEAQPLFTEQMSPLVNYVAVDDSAKAVVLTCRGTMGLSDILTDLTCDFETVAVEGGRTDKLYQVHSGMLASTRRLCSENSTVMQTVRLALEENPDYGLVITGHSLGGGVASLAAIELSCPSDLFRQQSLRRHTNTGHATPHARIYTPFVTSHDSGLPPGRPIHAYAFGVPAVTSPDLSHHSKGLITSIIHGHDFVPTLSLGMVRDFKNVAHALSEHPDSDVAREIITRVVGCYRKRSALRVEQKGRDHPDSLELPRPQELPLKEREMQLSREELMNGKTRNLATDPSYTDPNLREDDLDPFSYSSGGGYFRPSPSNPEKAEAEGDSELADWLWSLIKTIRADMDSAKLYPPGDVYCIESFPVFVTPRMQADSDIVFRRDTDSRSNMGENKEERDKGGKENPGGEKRTEAHRVILRYCEDVEKRFSEPIFAKSMLRDHIPTSYELCCSLLYESVMDATPMS
ncbi:uncharacterized protein MEPE_00369 [Melanopsichium pennsylvanicum]|uniref:sn-1-specific diacylglycerol lipase n=2 Tax=Melanopsichium pennsylvanicum TaxID=63383 RepID=A0AAJ4XFY2_9BASI|nr:sn1-specific diacylglycerol lipase alpha [Melanopsichium pennsylvanicum 4]SNX81664.1 uncharacterized protein MEPE_00369 [Melanopsichium pennsylvanicum]